MFDIGECSIRELKKNEMTIVNMPKKKCALRKGVTKWPLLEESVANWVLENRLNGLIATRNSIQKDNEQYRYKKGRKKRRDKKIKRPAEEKKRGNEMLDKLAHLTTAESRISRENFVV
ncbi:hypothetical protein TNCV_4988351 [Trichonephila clavipes]|nr:hypothetical protein TNCV_4988351 [Trichonephila clavipes]